MTQLTPVQKQRQAAKAEAIKRNKKDSKTWHVCQVGAEFKCIEDKEKQSKNLLSFWNTTYLLKKKISLVIGFHNEGQQVFDTIQSIYDTAPKELFDIILVNDASTVRTKGLNKFNEIRNVFVKERGGIGNAFDRGVAFTESENIILMGSDIRFQKNSDWLPKMIKAIEENERSLICTTCLRLNKENKDPNKKGLTEMNGADIVMYHTKEDKPNYRDAVQAKWRKKEYKEIYEIPCILGAFYGVRKEWYNYIRGFEAHKFWGTLEPYISLKSFLLGGDCKIHTGIKTGHIFKTKSTHVTPQKYVMYNKIMTANICFEGVEGNDIIRFLGNNQAMKDGMHMATANMSQIQDVKNHIIAARERNIGDFCKKWGVDVVNPTTKEAAIIIPEDKPDIIENSTTTKEVKLEAQIVVKQPSKRGRKPGSKNKKKTTKK